MAIYHLNASPGSRKGGQSAAAKSDYIARAGRYKKDRAEVALVESANMPDWVKAGNGRSVGAALDYWRQADKAERANGVLFRQVEFALPIELSEAERQVLARQFADELATVPGGKLPYTLAIHDKPGNPHCHLILSERINDGIPRDRDTWFKRAAASPKGKEVDPATGGARKADIASHRGDWLAETRERWAEVANAALETHGHGTRIDHRSNIDRGLRQHPAEHRGPQPEAFEQRTGQRSDRGRRLDARDELRKTIAPGITTRPPSVRRPEPIISPRPAELGARIAVDSSIRLTTAENTLKAALGAIEYRTQARHGKAIHALMLSSSGGAINRCNAVQKLRDPRASLRPMPDTPAVPTAAHRENGAESILAAALDTINQRKSEKQNELEQRRSAAFGECRGASSELAAGNRRLGEARNNIGRAERPALTTDHLAQRREQAFVRLGGARQPAGRHVLQRGGAVRGAFDRLDSAARRRTEVRELKAVDAVLIEQAEKRLEAAKPLAPSEPLTQPPAVAPAQPEKMLAERVAESLQAMLEWIKSVTGTLREAKPGGQYIGKISHADEHHAVQAQGHGFYTIHEQAKLQQRLDVGPAMVDIKYGKDGRGSVTVNERGGKGGRC